MYLSDAKALECPKNCMIRLDTEKNAAYDPMS